MGAIAYAFSEEGAGIDGKSFSLLPVEIFYRETGKTKKVTEYPCDGKLLKAAEQVKTKYHTGRGVIGSGDEWNNQLDRIALLRERYHTAVEDMESAAAAQLCLSYGVPFLGVRILSNSIVNGEKFDEAVGIDGQKFMLSLVDQMREYM
jgi:adenosylhomocysteine nucleosidase